MFMKSFQVTAHSVLCETVMVLHEWRRLGLQRTLDEKEYALLCVSQSLAQIPALSPAVLSTHHSTEVIPSAYLLLFQTRSCFTNRQDKSVDAERGPAFLVLLPGCVPLTLGSGTSKGGQERRVRKDSSQNPTVK